MKPLVITPAMNRRNGLLYLLMYLLIYLAAPVSYIGVVQAALCDKLGSNATIANLPSATYLLGGFAPLLLSLTVPHRLERAVLCWANGLTAVFLGLVCLTLATNLPPWIPLTVLVLQGLLQGFTASTAQVFTFQCLARGTTEEGRNRAFKRTYFLTPLFAVIGSLGAQWILNGGLHGVRFPDDFALLYAVGFVCMAGVTAFSFLFQLAPVAEEPRPPLLRHLAGSVRDYASSRPLVLLFVVYTLWNCALSITPNLSLYTRQAIGRDPKEFSGLIMAIRFGCKSLGGYLLGSIALRGSLRASVMTASLLLAAGTVWGWAAPGYAFLLAFGFLGAGELGGAYIPNYGVSLSRPETTARNISLLTLAQPVSSFSPALFGYLADHFGFGASFSFGLAMALSAVWLTTRIRQVSGE
ncbi:MAG TPA: MFS transporter [Bryobacteraceae bacterium]|nr:MFS transporter [Bryobacteraceae bacterium]